MVAIAVISSIVVLVASSALAIHGYRSVSGDFDALVRLVRHLAATASATGVRETSSRGEVTIVINPPRRAGGEQRACLVVLDAPDAEIEPKSQLVSPSAKPTELQFSLVTSKPARTNVAISIYDVKTLTPIARLDAVVPPLHQGFRHRIASFVQRG